MLAAVKLLLLGILCYFIYSQLNNYTNVSAFTFHSFLSVFYKSKFALIMVLLLMPINWLVEAIKWKYICNKHHIDVSLKQAYASVYFGACAGFISPGRWGEPIARSFYIGQDRIAQKFSISLIGIIAQWIITVLFALLSVSGIYFSKNALYLGALLFILFTLLFFYYEKCLIFLSSKFKLLQNIQIQSSSLTDKLVVFALTLLRFLIYTLQYILLFTAFTSLQQLPKIAQCTVQMFFVNSFSPLPGIVDYAYKNNVALFIFKKVELLPIEVLYVIFSVWVINLVIPSLVGYVLFSKKLDAYRSLNDIK